MVTADPEALGVAAREWFFSFRRRKLGDLARCVLKLRTLAVGSNVPKRLRFETSNPHGRT